MARIQTLKNKEGTIVYPQTHANAVFINEGEILQNKLENFLTTDTVKTFTNITVPTSSWVEDATYAQFLYKADIPCEGIAADYFPNVVFNIVEATSGNFAQVCQSEDNIITIYAVEIPTADIIIPSIVCIKEA